jgi:hypothetical protein
MGLSIADLCDSGLLRFARNDSVLNTQSACGSAELEIVFLSAKPIK